MLKKGCINFAKTIIKMKTATIQEHIMETQLSNSDIIIVQTTYNIYALCVCIISSNIKKPGL